MEHYEIRKQCSSDRTINNQGCSRGHKARGQDQGPKTSEAKDNPSEGRPSQSQGQKCSRPRTKETGASVNQKKGLQKFFSGDLQKKKIFKNIFQEIYKILTIQKIVLFLSRGQGNFRELEASRPRTSKCVLEAKDVLEDFTLLKNINTP